MNGPEYCRRRLMYLKEKNMESKVSMLVNNTWISGISRWVMENDYAKIETIYGAYKPGSNSGTREMRPMLNIVPYDKIVIIAGPDAEDGLTGGIHTGSIPTPALTCDRVIRNHIREMSKLDANSRLKLHVYLASIIAEKIYDYTTANDDVLVMINPWISPNAPQTRLVKSVAPYANIDILAIDFDIYGNLSPNKNTLVLPWE